jgi:hypothetical protein
MQQISPSPLLNFNCPNEAKMNLVLNRVTGLMHKISWEAASSVYTSDDLFQEMSVEVVKAVRKIPVEKSIDDLACLAVYALKNYRKYAFRDVKRIQDRSSNSVDVSEIQEYKPSSHTQGADVQLHQKELFSRVTKCVQDYDKQYPGLFQFFSEAIEPSSFVMDKLEEYKAAVSAQRGLGGSNIPPMILAKILGVTPRRLLTFKILLKKSLIRSGIAESHVSKYFAHAVQF